MCLGSSSWCWSLPLVSPGLLPAYFPSNSGGVSVAACRWKFWRGPAASLSLFAAETAIVWLAAARGLPQPSTSFIVAIAPQLRGMWRSKAASGVPSAAGAIGALWRRQPCAAVL